MNPMISYRIAPWDSPTKEEPDKISYCMQLISLCLEHAVHPVFGFQWNAPHAGINLDSIPLAESTILTVSA